MVTNEEKANKIVSYIYSLEETIKLQAEAIKKITDLWQISENRLWEAKQNENKNSS